MRKYLYIGIGGFIGAILRYAVRSYKIADYYDNLPINTLFVNVTGCFLLAFILTASFDFYKLHSDIRMGLSTGLFGAYTTFSTVCKETVQLLQNGFYLVSFVYITLSVILGLIAAYIGIAWARVLEKIIKGRINKSVDGIDREVK